MSVHAYTEDQLVEQPAVKLFAELGWQTVSAMDETFGAGGLLSRETKSEVVLAARLHAALTRLNPALPTETITAAIDELARDRSAMSLEAANREVYGLLKEGTAVSVPDHERGGQKAERLRVIDWDEPQNNDFLLVSQFSVTGTLYTCRPDLVGFVNGLPWVVIEFKKVGVPARAAFDENLTHYKHQVPALFWYNALLIASNGTDSRVGSLTADWERFFEWKRIEREDEPRRVSLEVMLRGTCAPTRLLDLVENFTLFSEHKAGLVKILSQNHQFLGVNNAIASMLEARTLGHGRGGVFWQTQGSGKSFSMVFFAQKVLRKVTGNWTFVVVTDRVELDEQIAKTFKTTGAVSEAEGDACHAASGAHLRELLRGNHRYVFTLVHKFQTPELLCDRSDVVVLTDEAHRSQYDTLALNMRGALPDAAFMGFTGTPLVVGEELTRREFGDYVSVYNFRDAIEDGATVPLYYENCIPELQLVNEDFAEELTVLLEEAELDEAAEGELIAAYNAGSLNIDEYLRRLVSLSQDLTAEERRTVSEDMTEEELALFDLLTRPDPVLDDVQRKAVRAGAKRLLATLHDKLVLDWRRKAATAAEVRTTIRVVLDQDLPADPYPPELFAAKVQAVFDHVFTAYGDDGTSVYAGDEIAPASGTAVALAAPADLRAIADEVVERIRVDAEFASLVAEQLGVPGGAALRTVAEVIDNARTSLSSSSRPPDGTCGRTSRARRWRTPWSRRWPGSSTPTANPLDRCRPRQDGGGPRPRLPAGEAAERRRLRELAHDPPRRRCRPRRRAAFPGTDRRPRRPRGLPPRRGPLVPACVGQDQQGGVCVLRANEQLHPGAPGRGIARLPGRPLAGMTPAPTYWPAAPGTSTVTVVPSPGRDSTTTLAPTRAARSCMPTSP